MAGHQKLGLQYFSFDVDIFEDEKLFDVTNEFGPLGEIIFIRLLCYIYKNGYYYKYENLDKLASMLIRSIGNRWARDRQVVMQVIPFLAKCNLFSLELMQENVLTSAAIQKRYLIATERRKPLTNKPYWLLDENESENIKNADVLIDVHKNKEDVYKNISNVYKDDSNVYRNATNKSKVNINSSSSIENRGNVFQFYEQNFGLLSPHLIDRINSFDDFTDEMIIKAMEIAIEQNKRNFKYVEGILNSWNSKGIKTVEAVDFEQKEHKVKAEQKVTQAPKAQYKTRKEKEMEKLKELYDKAIAEERGIS
jgi:DnaD/phage-associated family protein